MVAYGYGCMSCLFVFPSYSSRTFLVYLVYLGSIDCIAHAQHVQVPRGLSPPLAVHLAHMSHLPRGALHGRLSTDSLFYLNAFDSTTLPAFAESSPARVHSASYVVSFASSANHVALPSIPYTRSFTSPASRTRTTHPCITPPKGLAVPTPSSLISSTVLTPIAPSGL